LPQVIPNWYENRLREPEPEPEPEFFLKGREPNKFSHENLNLVFRV